MNYWEDKWGGIDNIPTTNKKESENNKTVNSRRKEDKYKTLKLTKEEKNILTTQLAYRCVELDKIIKEKAKEDENFNNQYELKKTLETILNKLYIV